MFYEKVPCPLVGGPMGGRERGGRGKFAFTCRDELASQSILDGKCSPVLQVSGRANHEHGGQQESGQCAIQLRLGPSDG